LSLRNRGNQAGQCGIRRGRSKVADDKALRRFIHNGDKGVAGWGWHSRDSCLGSTGLEVPTELNREAMRHSSTQPEESKRNPGRIDSSAVSLTTADVHR
jgi:hypothetical protein